MVMAARQEPQVVEWRVALLVLRRLRSGSIYTAAPCCLLEARYEMKHVLRSSSRCVDKPHTSKPPRSFSSMAARRHRYSPVASALTSRLAFNATPAPFRMPSYAAFPYAQGAAHLTHLTSRPRRRSSSCCSTAIRIRTLHTILLPEICPTTVSVRSRKETVLMLQPCRTSKIEHAARAMRAP